jgi:hypothetical protein
LFAVLSTVLLAGCAGGIRHWQEQVILPDGRELIVERSHTLGNRFDREIAAYNAGPSATAYTVTVPLPDGGKAVWQAEHKDMIPIAVAIEDKTAFVLATPFNCRAYAKYGRPIPPFFVFKSLNGQWQRTGIEEFPKTIGEANLMIDTSGQRSANEIEKGLVSAKVIKYENEINPRRRIYHEGVNQYLWGQCLRELAAGRYSQEIK